ncbi:MAG: SUMF1/EgtB/PvdO family nonheme iron enzyme [Candidatus Hydrogenedentes bacterium]|nr:SUMF1/EgtB/PvdO family nonheme iron enzyme [Candidatus Hydrogenedentota bacterium]
MKRRAVIVGVDGKAPWDFVPLQHAVDDAIRMDRLFHRIAEQTSFDSIDLLRNPSDDEVREAVRQRISGLGRGDLFVFYFAGHGKRQTSGKYLLLCPQADKTVLTTDDTNGTVTDAFLRSAVGPRDFDCLFLFDTCRSVLLPEHLRRRDALALGVMDGETRLRDLGREKAQHGRGACVTVYSCRDGAHAGEVPELKAGAFTWALEQCVLERLHAGKPVRVNESFIAGNVAERMRAHAPEQVPGYSCEAGAGILLAEGREAAAATPAPAACPAVKAAFVPPPAQVQPKVPQFEGSRHEYLEQKLGLRASWIMLALAAALALLLLTILLQRGETPQVTAPPPPPVGPTAKAQGTPPTPKPQTVPGKPPSSPPKTETRPEPAAPPAKPSKTATDASGARQKAAQEKQAALAAGAERHAIAQLTKADAAFQHAEQQDAQEQFDGAVTGYESAAAQYREATRIANETEALLKRIADARAQMEQARAHADALDAKEAAKIRYAQAMAKTEEAAAKEPDPGAEQLYQEASTRFRAAAEEAGRAKGEMSVDLGGGVVLRLVFIPPGTFLMGSPASEEGRGNDETQHEVTLTQGFWMGKYEVMQGQWERLMGSNPSSFKGDPRLPVENVSLEDCQEFIEKLNQRIAGGGFRLPTEAEWEYACRAGTTTPFHFGNTISAEQVNYDADEVYGNGQKGVSRRKTVMVAQFPANAWGLHDMHGNVCEWCGDWYGEYPSIGLRVLRGGSWGSDPGGCRSANRFGGNPENRDDDYGFRVVRVPSA